MSGKNRKNAGGNRIDKDGHHGGVGLDWLLDPDLGEPSKFQDDVILQCDRCGVEFKWNFSWKKYAICADCREALDEFEGKHEWHSGKGQRQRIRARSDKFKAILDKPDECCQDVDHVEHSDCKGGL